MTAKEILTQAGLHESHWGLRIIAAEARDEFTVQDLEDAQDWFSCACGKADPRIPRQRIGKRPLDAALAALGLEFYEHVHAYACFVEAAETLIAIEKRAAEILADMEEK